MELFDWLPTECADERYPMQLISGELVCGDRIIRVPAGKIVNNGWGEIGSRRLVGEALKPVPERLELAWFSFAEDQFFAGTVELPKAELTDLFRAGFRDPRMGNVATWSKLIVGMGLGGWTSVWLAGSGLVREVARVKLEPEALDWTRVLDNPDIARADYVRSKLRSRLSDVELRALAKHGPRVASWTRYSRRQRWRIIVEGLQVPLHMFLRSFNGDRSFYDFARQPPQDLDVAPKHLQITWQARGDRRLLTNIRFDEQELFEAFDKAAAPDTTTILRVEFGTRSRIAISVEGRDARIPLTRSRVELASLTG